MSLESVIREIQWNLIRDAPYWDKNLDPSIDENTKTGIFEVPIHHMTFEGHAQIFKQCIAECGKEREEKIVLLLTKILQVDPEFGPPSKLVTETDSHFDMCVSDERKSLVKSIWKRMEEPWPWKIMDLVNRLHEAPSLIWKIIRLVKYKETPLYELEDLLRATVIDRGLHNYDLLVLALMDREDLDYGKVILRKLPSFVYQDGLVAFIKILNDARKKGY
jgi:hypothetical protein